MTRIEEALAWADHQQTMEAKVQSDHCSVSARHFKVLAAAYRKAATELAEIGATVRIAGLCADLRDLDNEPLSSAVMATYRHEDPT